VGESGRRLRGLESPQRDALHPSASALPRPWVGAAVVTRHPLPPQSPPRWEQGPWSTRPPRGAGRLRQPRSVRARRPSLPREGCTRAVPSRGSGTLAHQGPARCQLPPPPLARVLKLCCQRSPTRTRCPRSLLAGLTRSPSPRCGAKACNRSPCPRPPRSPLLLSAARLWSGRTRGL